MNKTRQKGFTLIELMVVVAIIGVLVAIALPNYQRSVIKTKRTDMMTELQNMASRLESQKVAIGSYKDIPATNLPSGNYPQSGTSLYTVATTLDSDGKKETSGDWEITATPISSGQMKDDGVLSINFEGKKCRGTKCGFGQEWKD